MLATLLTVPAHADDPEYLRGYLNALLETRFPGYGLRVRQLYPDGRVVLYSDTCIGPWQRRRVAESIQDTGRVTEVTWDKRVDCRSEPSEETKTATAIDIRSLPETPMFAPMLADPRQPRFSVSYLNYQNPTRTFNAASVAFGEYFGFASGFDGRNGSAQVGLQGAVFALFDLDSASKDLVNADYWIGLPFTYRRGRLSYVARVYHQSSHLGDEFFGKSADRAGQLKLRRLGIYCVLRVGARADLRRWRLSIA